MKTTRQLMEMETIFDAFPTEINVQIVRSFRQPSITYYHTALAFANCSKHCHRAVIQAFSNRLYVTNENITILPDLVTMLGDDLHDFQVDSGLSIQMSVPSIPSLRKASISGTEDHLRLIRGISSLTCLRVIVDNDICWNTLVTTFASLHLLHLEIYIFSIDLPPPPVRVQEKLSQACIHVKELTFTSLTEGIQSYWPLISQLRSLKYISLHGDLNLYGDLNFFQGLEEVRLTSLNSVQQAARIGHRVTCIEQRNVATEHALSGLSRCPNLKFINICLVPGAERALAGVKIDNVQRMDLCWGNPLIGGTYMNGEQPWFHPDGDLLLELVKRAPNLQHVSFERAVVKIKHIRGMLKSLGPRLTDFSVHLEGQGERKQWRVAKILECLSIWCPNIEAICFFGESVPVSATDGEMNDILVTLERLERNCPDLNIQSVREDLHM